MGQIIQAIEAVFSEKKNVALGIISAFSFGAIFAFGSGMITFFPEGPFIELKPLRFVTFVLLALLSGITVPMQWYVFQKVRGGLKTTTTGIGGMLAGTATMSCCAPLLLPAFLSFLGFSGIQLLSLNMAIRQYILPLSFFSITLLFISLVMASRNVVATCRVDIKKKP